MSITVRDSLAFLTVPELKDLVSHLPGSTTATREDDLIERIVVVMLGPELTAIWSRPDETRQAAVAEAAHHPLGEYSDRRFCARYQRALAFRVAAAKSYGDSAGNSTAWCLFILYARDDGCHVVPTDWRARLQAFLSRYDGLSAFRVTPLGAYLPGREAAYQPPAVASGVALSFAPGLHVDVVRGVRANEETRRLDNRAIPVQAGTWRLDRKC